MDQQTELQARTPVRRKPWVRVTAFLLAAVMVFSLWAGSAITIRIRPENEQDAAAQYLIDNTDYIQQDELERLQETIRSYRQATELMDHYRAAGIRIAAGEYAEALESIGNCLQLYQGEDPALYADLMLKKGCLQVLLGSYPEAVATLETVLTKDPGQADAYLVLAQICAETGDLPGLASALTAYLKLRPQDSEIRMVQAQTFFELGQYPQALEAYDSLLAAQDMADRNPQLRFLKALAWIQMESYAEAEELLLQLQQEQAQLQGLSYYLGVCQMSREAYEDAAASFTQALQLQQMLQLSHYSRGVCRLMQENFDYEGAVQDLNAALQYQGDDRDAAIAAQAESLLEAMETTQTSDS